MSSPTDQASPKPLNFRRYKDGNTQLKSWQD